MTGSSLFPADAVLAAMLSATLPACRDARARVVDCRVREVVTGRRGKVFALADADVMNAGGSTPATRRVVLQRYPDGADAVEEGRKVYRRLRRLARERDLRKQLAPWAGFIRDERMLVLPFPFDYRLPALVDACEPAAVAARLHAEGIAHSVQSLAPIRYVPEKRCQIRYEVETASGAVAVLYGKVMADEGGARVVERMRVLHRAFASSVVAGTPEPVAYIPEWRMVLQRAVPGATIYDLQRSGEPGASVYERAGAALAAVHDTQVPDLPSHTSSDELTLLASMLRKEVLPASAQAPAERLLARLRIADACLVPQRLTTSHRDFYDKQILWGDGRLWVIDLDTLALAPRGLDVGNFLAHVRLRHRQGHLPSAAARRAAVAFVDGYDADVLVEPSARHWWTAAALLRLAVVYSVRPAWRHLAPCLVADAWTVLAQSGFVEVGPAGMGRAWQ